jgi:Zn-dependent protease with chaperone function
MRAFAVIALLALSACVQPTAVTPHVTQAELAQEESAQAAMAEQVRMQGGNPQNWQRMRGAAAQFERVGKRVEEAAAQMCRTLGIAQQRPCYYYLEMESRDKSINAHADGEKVVVAGGMMRFVESDEELAMVMAHELAHNLLGHPQSTQQNAMIGGLVGTLADALASSQGINTQGGFGNLGANVAVLRYSPAFEHEADYVGMYIMANAGYDIRNAPDFWRRMSLQDPDGIYIRTSHPTNPERFIALNKTVTEINYKRKHRQALVPEFKPPQ